jgi:DNA-directed RNA polymerase subunit RPC12/RpoP
MIAGAQDGGREVVCPHCAKHFTARLLAADSALRGFKCPHCRLFVPQGRAEHAPVP